MKHEIQKFENHALIKINEKIIDYDVEEQFKQIIKELKNEGYKHIEIDLVEVEGIQSVAIGMLMLFKQQFKHDGGSFKVVKLSKEVEGIFDLAGLGKMFNA